MAFDPARAKSLFLAASDMTDPAVRAAFIAQECGDDPALRDRVEALLRINDDAPLSVRLATDATQAMGPHSSQDVEQLIETVIAGKYKLIEEIGVGGMGSVFMAQQTEPVKRAVAVKVIKAGLGSKAVLARFEAERQALAMMDHPNIAKVLDAGTTDAGRPFFVMELVKGVPITRFCDERKLTPRERLELIVPVCHAIQHAHQKGIIHRDIKPSNVLVALYDDRPVPKVIDFGIAKATEQPLTEMTLMTGYGAVVGTPEYMSPEQASFNQIDVDTRSDVYSLGVLLFELLTGTTPVDASSLGKAALMEVLRIVREVEAPRPSTKLSNSAALASIAANRNIEPAKLGKLMKGELDWIILKSLEKDRVRRYESANGLAADVLRYLSGEAVQAHPPSKAYRLRKFVRRNKGQVIAVSLVMFALMVGMIGTTIGYIQASRQQALALAAHEDAAFRALGEQKAKEMAEKEAEKARRQAGIADAVRAFLERDLIAQANPLEVGRADVKPDPELKLKTALDRAVFHIGNRFEGKPLVEASIRRAIARAYLGRGLIPEALKQLETSCALYKANLSGKKKPDAEEVDPYIEALFELIGVQMAEGKLKETLPTLQAVEDAVRLVPGDASDTGPILEAVAAIRDLVNGKDARAAIQKTQATIRKLMRGIAPGERIGNAKFDESKGAPTEDLERFTSAIKLMGDERYPEAEAVLQKMIASKSNKDGPDVWQWTAMLAEVYRSQGKLAQARSSFESSRDGLQKTLGEDHPSLFACRHGLAEVYLDEKKFDLAEKELRAVLAYFERRTPNDIGRFEGMWKLGKALMGQQKYAEAEPLLLAAFTGWSTSKGKEPDLDWRSPTAIDTLIDLYSATMKPDQVTRWRAVRATYPAPGKVK